MAGKILEELHQTKPFLHVEEEAFLNVHRTADVLMQALLAVLRPAGLSPTQYNVLRILRGAGEAGVTCKEIGMRMITPDPDITRLLDRLEKRALILRSRAKEDRRFVAIQITKHGIALLAELDEPIRDVQLRAFGHMDEERIRSLVDLLETVRERS